MVCLNTVFLKHFLFLLFGIPLIFITYKVDKRQNFTQQFPKPKAVITEPEIISNAEKYNKIITISFFTNFYDDLNEWRFFRTKKDYMKECGYALRNCRLNYDKSNWTNSDLVFFHGRDMPRRKKLEAMKKLGKPGQLWIYYILESTIHTPNHQHDLNHLFELVSSYRRTSDMFSPYGEYEALTSEEKLNASKNQTNYADGKTKQIYWIVSHCGAPRDKLVRLLEKHGLEVDVGGGCRYKYKRRLSKASLDKAEILKAYKFYLSFENTFCTDYITEKYWYTPVVNENIPIVLGGANYDSKVSIPGSFINAFDFTSPKELAEYIKKVASNDTLYNQYFEWKKYYKVYQSGYFSDGCSKSMDLFCQKLHSEGINLRKDALLKDINKTRECKEQTKQFEDWIKK